MPTTPQCTCFELGATAPGQRHTLCRAHRQEPTHTEHEGRRYWITLDHTGAELEIQLEEFWPYEPSAFHYDPGYLAYEVGREDEEGASAYFISLDSGEVYTDNGEAVDAAIDYRIGICRYFEQLAERRERDFDDAVSRWPEPDSR